MERAITLCRGRVLAHIVVDKCKISRRVMRFAYPHALVCNSVEEVTPEEVSKWVKWYGKKVTIF
jgi:hypothetical protein